MEMMDLVNTYQRESEVGLNGRTQSELLVCLNDSKQGLVSRSRYKEKYRLQIFFSLCIDVKLPSLNSFAVLSTWFEITFYKMCLQKLKTNSSPHIHAPRMILPLNLGEAVW